MNIASHIDRMGKQLLALAVLTAILSVGGIVGGIGPASDSEVFGYTRIALGVTGLVGAALLMAGRQYGRTGFVVILVWATAQSLYYADAPDGNYTRQLVDGLIGLSNSTTVNGIVTEYNAVGLNLVGLGMLLFAWACRTHVDRCRNRTTIPLHA